MALMRVDRSKALFVAFLGAGVPAIVLVFASWPNPEECMPYLSKPSLWLAVFLRTVVPVALTLAAAWLARLGYFLVRAALRTRRLHRVERPPARLADALVRTGLRRVRCISSSAPVAFCTGALRPVILVSDGLAERLRDDELDAVLLHEEQHVRDREPLIRAACEAAAGMLFFVPIARWWARRRTEEAELRADRAAVRQVGRQPVAAALCTLDAAIHSEAAFAGVATLRVAQLLGEPLPVQRPAAWLITASLVGLPFAVVLFGCLFAMVLRIALP
ncbi:MAG TPA: M56 family metallopeptidase [Candidatus Dormibacteraeota bacterium]|nr:M56 family metallopeptidase [Candidatus Dormibacteraeota bacterium]